MARPQTLRFFVTLAAAVSLAVSTVATAPALAAKPESRSLAVSESQHLTSAMAARLSKGPRQSVIVIMKSQPRALPAGNHANAVRSQAIRSSQRFLLSELHAVRASRVHAFQLVDAVAATVSSAEATRLRDNPAVARIISDSVIHLARPQTVAPVRHTVRRSARRADLTPNVIPGACSATTPQLTPEGLSLTQTNSDNLSAQTARSLGITGAGVKVAYIADGIDPNNINFIRANSTSAFVDYQDFTGDGPGQPTNGDEAFLDANTIAGQGLHTYDVSNFSAQPDPTACNIRIEGVAPGASLVGLDVFGTFEVTTESNFLQAINYAVQTDHVNVINESFGSNPFPDITSLDVTKMFDDAAVQAGVTVTVSSGDAGITNTIGSPASDPNLISVGASTQLQMYAQSNEAGARYFATTGWLSDNISALSSAGFSETGSTVDLVAPGDLSFSSCDASPVFAGCVNFKGQSSPVESAGGTSESSPFVAGAVALVIQAYRQAHGGASPSPALIKNILLSSATDIGAPAQEQGAGLLNTYKAVQEAESISTSDGSPAPTGSTLRTSVNQLNATGLHGRHRGFDVTITNTGSASQALTLRTRTIGPDQNVQTGSVTLNDATSPQFTGWTGATYNYATITFNVPANQDRLDASIAYPGNPANGNNQRIRIMLIDPSGRLAAYSLPQGVSNFGNVDVTAPASGTWTGVIFGVTASNHGANGTVPWRVATQKYHYLGKVVPNSLSLNPGQSTHVTVTEKLPKAPGDVAGSLDISNNSGPLGDTSIPITLRTLVDATHNQRFSGTLTGGNGRPSGEGQELWYEFRVRNHQSNITADLALTNDAGDAVGAYLVDPQGNVAGYGQNSLNGSQTTTVTAYAANPVPGMWTLIVALANNVVGDETQQQLTGRIHFNASSVSAPALPDRVSRKLTAGTPLTVPVQITNRGTQPEDFFLDPRLDHLTTVNLAPFSQASGLALPLVGGSPVWFVPTEASIITISATASLPIMFDFGTNVGDPDLASGIGTNPSALFAPSEGQLSNGFWFATPSEIGPYPSGAPAGTVSLSAQATIRAFDPAMGSSTGDLEPASINPATTFSPIVINPGQTATITLTITPSGASGTQVHGTLYLDDFMTYVPPYGAQGADEIVGLPYAYTIK